MTDRLHVTLMSGLAAEALTATRYTHWVRADKHKECGFAIHCPATGSPVGTWSVQGSNDPLIGEELRLQVHGASSAAKKFTLTTNTVHGSALANTTGAAQDSFVALTQGLPRWVRLVYTYVSGGTVASLPTVFFHGME